MPDWRRNFRYTWLNNFLSAAGMMAFLPILPLYVRELGVRDLDAVQIWSGVVTGAAPFFAALLAPIWGELGDRLGYKPMMVRANLAIVIFVGAMSFATSPWMLLAFRIGQGVFSGFIAPAMTLVSVQTPDERQGRVTGLLQTGALTGGVFGPFLGGFISDALGLQAAFVACSGLSLAAMLVTVFGIREPERSPERAARRKVYVADLLATAVRGFLRLLAPGPLRSLLATVFVIRFAGILANPILALFVEDLAGATADRLATWTGLVFVSAGVANLSFASLWGRLGDRWGHARLLASCAAASGVFFALTGLVTHVGALLALRFIAAAFVAGVFPAAYAMATKLSPVAERGRTHGFTFSALALANSLGPIGGGAVAAGFGLRATFWTAGVLLTVPAILFFILHRRRRARAAVASAADSSDDGSSDSVAPDRPSVRS